VDIAVSVIPMLHGEAVVMRLLRQNATLRGMGELDMEERELVSFRRILSYAWNHSRHGSDRSGQNLDAVHRLNEINQCPAQ